MSTPTRKDVLLRAAYDLLKKCGDSHFVVSPMEVTAFYDGTDCDGSCLMDDIAIELELEQDADPLRGPRPARR